MDLTRRRFFGLTLAATAAATALGEIGRAPAASAFGPDVLYAGVLPPSDVPQKYGCLYPKTVELQYQSDSSLNGTLLVTFEQPADLPVFPVCKSTDYGQSWTQISSVADTGARPGTAVPQLYLSDPIAAVTRPVRQLIGFARVELGRVNAARSGSTWTRT